MAMRDNIKAMIPESIKKIIRKILYHPISKHDAELSFWKSRVRDSSGLFKNSHYERLMLAMAKETTDDFLKGKIVADFGCGPRGSLVWASSALLRIGIDVLTDRYADEFADSIITHGMIYLKSTEKVIPLPSGFVDIMFTLNAMDHVDNFSIMCNEIVRVLKPGGEFIGSFNLEEPATPFEPQQLNEKIIKENLLSRLEVQSYRITEKGSGEDQYAPFFINGSLSYRPGQEGCLWVRARKTD
ncbi:MAG: methyltransferase domain-containing protein [Candidatus Omnitrophota bacterium]